MKVYKNISPEIIFTMDLKVKKLKVVQIEKALINDRLPASKVFWNILH